MYYKALSVFVPLLQIHGNYEFGYDERHTSGGSFRHERGDAYGRKYGSYGLTDADGRIRIVHYIADENGFRVSISTNEPGTAASAPAGASINIPDPPKVPVPAVHVAAVEPASAPVVPVQPVHVHPVAPTPHFAQFTPVAQVAPAPIAAPAAVNTYETLPAVSTYKRVIPGPPAPSYVFNQRVPVAAGGPAPYGRFPVNGPHGYGFRRAVLSPVAPSYSSGFVPTLPYAGPAVGPAGGHGGYFLKSATSYSPTTVVSPAFGSKLAAAAGPALVGSHGPVTYGGGYGASGLELAGAYGSRPLGYSQHLADKLGASYLKKK